MPVYQKVKSNSRVSKAAKKGKFKLKKWMIFTGIGVIALVGFIVLRYSFASIELPDCSPEPVLTQNNKASPSDCVINLQVKLNTVMGSKLSDNGIYDDKTAKVVKDFQIKYKIAERNQVGTATWAVLDVEFDKKTQGQVVGPYKVAVLQASDGSKVQANACLSLNKQNVEQVRVWYKKITSEGRKKLPAYAGYYIASTDQARSQVRKGNIWVATTNESLGSPATFRLRYPDQGFSKYSAGTNNFKLYVGIGYNVAGYTTTAATKTVSDNILGNGGQAIDVKALNLCPDSRTLPVQKPASKPKISVKTTKSAEAKPPTPPTPAPAPAPNPPPTEDLSFLNYPGYNLSLGSVDGAVKIMQTLLCINPVDGVFGPQTSAEVRRYQELNNLQVDGIVGPLTWGSFISGVDYKPLCAGEPPAYVGGSNPNPIVIDDPGTGSVQLELCKVTAVAVSGAWNQENTVTLYSGYMSRDGCLATARSFASVWGYRLRANWNGIFIL